MKKRIIFISVIFVVFVLLYNIGCAQEKISASFSTEVSSKAVDFTLIDVEGKNVRLKDFIGREVILLVFSTTWCPYCNEEIPELKRLHDKYDKKGIEIISVYIQESQRKLESFVKEKNIPYTILLDLDGAVARQYEVRGVPTLIVIDKKGIIRERGHQSPDESVLEGLIEE